jgi:hypothetical protein
VGRRPALASRYTYSGVDGSRVEGCTINGAISTSNSGSTIASNTVTVPTSFVGILINGGRNNTVQDNAVSSPVGGDFACIYLEGPGIQRNLVDSNHVSGCNTGIKVDAIPVAAPPNVITRNWAIKGGSDYSIGASNDAGPTGTAAGSVSPWANIAE